MSICSACEHNSVYHWNDSGCQFQDCDCRLNRSDPEFSARHDERGNVMSRPEPVATADLAAQARGPLHHMSRVDLIGHMRALAKALEDTAAERDRAHETLREIEACDGNTCFGCKAKARERLENP